MLFRSEYKGQRYFASVEIGERCQKDHHEHDTARAHQAGFEQEYVEDPGYKGCYDSHDGQPSCAITAFKDGTEKQDEREVAQKMIDVRVPEYMQKKPQVIGNGGSIEPSPSGDRKQGFCKSRNQGMQEQYDG